MKTQGFSQRNILSRQKLCETSISKVTQPSIGLVYRNRISNFLNFFCRLISTYGRNTSMTGSPSSSISCQLLYLHDDANLMIFYSSLAQLRSLKLAERWRQHRLHHSKCKEIDYYPYTHKSSNCNLQQCVYVGFTIEYVSKINACGFALIQSALFGFGLWDSHCMQMTKKVWIFEYFPHHFLTFMLILVLLETLIWMKEIMMDRFTDFVQL